MTIREFTLPDLGEGLTEAELVRWLVKVGQTIAVDQPVAEVETAKAMVEVPSPYPGVVRELAVSEGAVVDVGAVLLRIDQPGPADRPVEGADTPPQLGREAERYVVEERAGSGNVLVGYGTAQSTRRRSRRKAARTRPLPVTERVRVSSPLVRRLAKESAVDLHALTGSGPDGLITRSDVLNAIAPPQPQVETAAETRATTRPVKERIALRGPRKAAAAQFTRSRREIPEATTWVDVDATELVRHREEINARAPQPIGILALIARFVVAGLVQHPLLNSQVDAETGEVVVFDGVNLGFAAQTDRGLVVPVLKDAHTRNARGIHEGLSRLTAAAREGTLTVADLTGGTFTLNNYGVFGVDGAAPIINHPEAAILGVGRILDRAWAVEGELAVRKITTLSLAFDHRVCDGGTAAAFLRFVADCIEDPQQALTAL